MFPYVPHVLSVLGPTWCEAVSERCQVAAAMWQFRDASKTSCQWGFHIPYLLQGLGKFAIWGIFQHHIQDLQVFNGYYIPKLPNSWILDYVQLGHLPTQVFSEEAGNKP